MFVLIVKQHNSMLGTNIALDIDLPPNTEHAGTAFKATRNIFATQKFSVEVEEKGERTVPA